MGHARRPLEEPLGHQDVVAAGAPEHRGPAEGSPDHDAALRRDDRRASTADARRAVGVAELSGGALSLLSRRIAHLLRTDDPVATDRLGTRNATRVPRRAAA